MYPLEFYYSFENTNKLFLHPYMTFQVLEREEHRKTLFNKFWSFHIYFRELEISK